MLSTRYRGYTPTIGRAAHARRMSGENVWTEETFLEDAQMIAKLMRENRLSQEDGEVMLEIMLSYLVSAQVDSLAYEIQDQFERVLEKLVMDMTDSENN